ncbi:ABC transporter permease [Anaeromyxobacter oryzae]|uniref:ABC transmembrane type-1 domain-containing protein n=1 Tax=Anaeromyxobacter oryzae TaxID=2918170 RepID=A0ABN6MN50_9BACT|nr:ABC transporter permease [Anaeromyxobacter oryzae]BDG02390.1 hypothetical protein AMOR_13860 [Anaeromyxobacter oryzae]
MATVSRAVALPLQDRRALALPLVVIAAWSVASSARLVNPDLVPSPALVARTAWTELTVPNFWSGVAASLGRTACGFTLAAAAGVILGTVLGVSRWADRLVGPSFHAYRQVAVFAWIPLLSAWFGGGESTKIAFVAVAAVTPVVINTFEGVHALPREHVELARVLELGRLKFVTGLLLPYAAPQILTGLHLALVTAWLATFGAEFFLQIAPGASRTLIEGRALGRMDLVLVGIAVNGLIGFGLTTAIGAVERHVLRWRPARPATSA